MLAIRILVLFIVSLVSLTDAFNFNFDNSQSRARVPFAQITDPKNISNSDQKRQQNNPIYEFVIYFNYSQAPMSLLLIGPEQKNNNDILMAPLLTTEELQYISEENRYINTSINISFCGAPQTSLIKRIFPNRYDSFAAKIIGGEECLVTRFVFRPRDPKYTLELNFQKLLITLVGAVQAQIIWNNVSALIPKTKLNSAGRAQFTYAVLELKVSMQDQVHSPIPSKDIKLALNILDEYLVCNKSDPASWRMAQFFYFEYMPQTNTNYPHKYILTGLDISNSTADIHSHENHVQITKLLIMNYAGLTKDNFTWKLKYKSTKPKKGFVTYVILISSTVPIHEEYEAIIDHKGKFQMPDFRTGPLLGKVRKITLQVCGWKRKIKVNKVAERNSERMKKHFEALVEAELFLVPICTQIMDDIIIHMSPTRQISRSGLINMINKKLFVFHQKYAECEVDYTVESIIKYGKLNYKWRQKETPEFGVIYKIPTSQSEIERRGGPRTNISENTFTHMLNLSILGGDNLDTLTGPSEFQGLPV